MIQLFVLFQWAGLESYLKQLDWQDNHFEHNHHSNLHPNQSKIVHNKSQLIFLLAYSHLTLVYLANFVAAGIFVQKDTAR